MKTVQMSKEISTLTSIEEKYINQFGEFILYSFCQNLLENIQEEKDELIEFNFWDLFKVYVKYEDPNNIKYKIVPCATLQEKMVDTAKNKLNLLEGKVTKTFIYKFMDLYKSLL